MKQIIRIIGVVIVCVGFTSTLAPQLASVSKSGEVAGPTDMKDNVTIPVREKIDGVDDVYEQFREIDGTEGQVLGVAKNSPYNKQQEAHEGSPPIEQDGEDRKSDEATTEPSIKTIDIEFTYYTAKCKGCIGITKSGYNVKRTVHYEDMRIVAVDPNVIPLHSIIEFELYGKKTKAIALDIGGAIKGNRIDLLVATKKEALELGRAVKEVKVIRVGK